MDREDAGAPVPSRRARYAAHIRGLAVDISPLRESRSFRMLWLGELVSHTGRHITVVALPYHVFLLTDSALMIGLIGLVQVVPLVGASLAGGVLADRVDRRKLLIVAQLGLAASSLLLVWASQMDRPPLALLYGAAALIGAFSGLDAPIRTAAIPNLVKPSQLSAAIALNQTLFQVSDIVGPSIGGLLIAKAGLAWAYAADSVSFVIALATVLAIAPMPPKGADVRRRPLAAFREGLAYLRGRRVLRSTFYIDLVAMIFGMPRALFPVLAARTFAVGPDGLGLLYAAPAAGALLGALASGWVGRVSRQGVAVIWAVVIWGLAIAAFGLTEVFWLGLGFLAIAGAADVISAVFRSTILQSSIPDRLRGRLSSIHIAVVVGGPRLGDLEAGVVARLVSPAFSVVSGGLACVVGVGLLAWRIPELVRYRAGDPA